MGGPKGPTLVTLRGQGILVCLFFDIVTAFSEVRRSLAGAQLLSTLIDYVSELFKCAGSRNG